jgi:hypothetical protein
MPDDDKEHIDESVSTQGYRGGVQQPEQGPPFPECSQKQPTGKERPKKKSRVSSRVLAKPDMLVGKSKQGGGKDPLLCATHLTRQQIQDPNTPYPEKNRWKAQ